MEKNRVVITGMGITSCLGNNIETFYSNTMEGKSGITPLPFELTEEFSSIGGIVKDGLNPTCLIDANFREYSRINKFSISSTFQALEQANLLNHEKDLIDTNIPIYIATAISDMLSMEKIFLNEHVEDTAAWEKHFTYDKENGVFDKSDPFNFSSLSDNLKSYFKTTDDALTIMTGCTGGLDALGYGFQQILNGKKQRAIVSAVDCPVTPFVLGAFSKINAVTRNKDHKKGSRPLDKNRDGFVLSEGSASFVLESLESAINRNANILAEIKGYASGNNGEHMTNINTTGLPIANIIEKCFKIYDINKDTIDFINLHGSSTKQNDLAETNAVKHVFKNRGIHIPVTSNKAALGHALGASNAIETVSTVLSLLNQTIPPTVNVTEQDEQCDLFLIREGMQKENYSVNNVLKISSGFSGIHSVLVVSKYSQEVLV